MAASPSVGAKTSSAPALGAGKARAQEITFGFDELFFSRTDQNGIIKYGNSVFQRVAIYPWRELESRPHKIVRHPDMPRAVFWALWRTIEQGRPIGAYVKNRAKDGRFYWVFAIVTPIPGGYLSVRLRPSSAVFGVVESEYADLVERERREEIDPQASAAILMARLGALGFPDYGAFMASALGAELAARDARLQRAPDGAIARYQDLVKTAQSLLDQAEVIASAYSSNENVSFNFRVLAAQLGQDGAAIGVISSNYALLSGEMKNILVQFTASAREVFATINDGFFLAAVARVQSELLEFFADETPIEGLPREQEMALLNGQKLDYLRKAREGLHQISRRAGDFRQACAEMNRLAAGLGVTRIMGRVECARHAHIKERTEELLNSLHAFQTTVTAALKEIDAMNEHIRVETNGLLEPSAKAA